MTSELSNDEFQRIMEVPKEFTSTPKLPEDIEKKTYLVKSKDQNETFIVTAERNRIFELSKSKLNTSYSREPIFRVEYNSRPHRNPDGERIGRNHVHIYREGYGMSWAYPLETFDSNLFKNPDNFNIFFDDFCTYCNIGNLELIQGVI